MNKPKKKPRNNLKDMCLHCMFFRAALHKWGDQRDTQEAFQDITDAAVCIAAEALSNLSDEGKMAFLQNVMERMAEIDGDEAQMTKH